MPKHHHHSFNHQLHLAVVAALSVFSMSAQAACTGTIASPNGTMTTLCNGTGAAGNMTNSTATIDATAASAVSIGNTLIQFDGQGRTLNNTGSIINNREYAGTTGAAATRARTAVSMGAATQNATLPSVALAAGATTITATAATPTWVGQTIMVGRYDPAQGDMFNGNVRTITAVNGTTVTLSAPLDAGFDPGVALGSELRYKVISNYGAGPDVINNSGTISAQITATEIAASTIGSASASHTAAAKGITTTVEGSYIINNKATGRITASSAGIGAVYGIEAGGTVTDLTVNNDGLISATRTAPITLATNSATALTATSGAFSAQTLAQVNAINTQEELDSFTLNNHATGVIRAEGAYSGAIYMRAAEQTIVNDGLIEHVIGTPGFAIGSVSDSGEIRTLELKNNGTINGDILAVNGQAQRWQALSTAGVLNNRLNINSQWGQNNSNISNAGTITGNLYFSNGTHVLSNEQDATITGNIDLDQRNTICANCTTSSPGENTTGGTLGVASTWTVAGSKNFTFENAGDYTGNLTIRTAAASQAILIPTVSGNGTGSTLEAPSHNMAGMGDTLTIDATAGTGNVTIAPKSLVTAKAGEHFLVADSLTLTGGATIPTISSANTPLVHWNIATNTAGNLVASVGAINDAASIAGISATSVAAINGLMTANTALGGSVQNLTLAADLEKAGQQLRPEANNASMQATITAVDHFASLIVKHQDEVRTASNGKILLAYNGNGGLAIGESAQGVGVWMEGFGFKGDQNKRDGIDGYTANTGGFVLGGDKSIGNGDFRLGLALGYASTGIDGQGMNVANRTDIDSYQATLYGSWNAGTWYLDAALGYGKNQYDTKRYVALANETLAGNHDANQYLAKIGGGYPMQMGKVTVTPIASLTYVNLDQDGYTEKSSLGALGAPLTVSGVSTDSLRSGLGAQISVPVSEGAIKTAIDARLMWHHEFADTNQDIAARFAGGTDFTTNGVRQNRDSANIGLGLNLSTANHQNLSVSYDAEVKSSYVGHTAAVKFRYDF